MKTLERESILKRFINILKNNPVINIFKSFINMVISPDSEVTSAENTSTETLVENLAADTNTSKEDIWKIERAFNESSNSLESLEQEVTRVPKGKEENNPFKVDEADLQEISTEPTPQKSQQSLDRDRADD